MVIRERPKTGILAAFAAVSILSACSNPPPGPTRRAEAIQPSERLYSDDRAEVDSARVVITDMETLRFWWSRATAEAADPKPGLPDVDFESQMVLLAAAGLSNSGDRIRIDSIGFGTQPEPGGGQREVWFAVVRTTLECDPFPGASYPLDIVRVPRAEPPIDWIERRTECPDGPESAGEG